MATATPIAAHRRSRFIELCSRPSSPSHNQLHCAATDNDDTACARTTTSTTTPSTSDNSSTTNTLTTPSPTPSPTSLPTSNIATPIRPHPIHRSSHPAFDVTLEQVLADHQAWERKRDKRASTASWGSFGVLFAQDNGSKTESRSPSRSGRRTNTAKGLASAVAVANTATPPPAGSMVGRDAAMTTAQLRRPPIYHSASSFTSGSKHAQSYQRASIRTVSTATNQSSQTTSSVASAASAASSRTTASRSSTATSFSSMGQPSRRSSLSAAFGLGRGLGGSLKRKGTGAWRSRGRGEQKEGDVVVLEIEEAADEMPAGAEIMPMMGTKRVRPKSSMGLLSTPAMTCLGEERKASTTASTSPVIAKNDTVPAEDDEQISTTSTEANVALALAQLTQPSPSKPSSPHPIKTSTPREEELTQPPPPTNDLALALAFTTNADIDQVKMQAKAKTKSSKRWSRMLPWNKA